MSTIRQRIMDYLAEHRTATAAEIGLAFQMSSANARRHLNILMKQGSVQVISERPASVKGRPGRLFALSEAILGNNLDLIASELLRLMSGATDWSSVEGGFRTLAKRLASRMIALSDPKDRSILATANLTRRLNHLTIVLNCAHYQSRWEAHREAPHLILGHCPYAAIIREHPELCQLDAEVIQQLLLQPVKQSAKLATDAAGAQSCKFMILS